MTSLESLPRPALRYHGGKWRLAPWIISHFPAHRLYCEPYCGGASVLMRKPRAKVEVINDRNGEVVNFFKVMRDPAAALELQHRLRLTPYARDELDAAYVITDDPVEQARRTVVKSFQGFGGATITPTRCRHSFRCSTLTRALPHDQWVNYPDLIPEFTARLKGVVIENAEALNVIRRNDSPDTLFYLDPPYPLGTRKDKGRTYAHEMSDEEHRELAAALRQAKGMAIVSSYPSNVYADLYRGWRRVEVGTVTERAGRGTECLWLSPNIEPARLRLVTEKREGAVNA